MQLRHTVITIPPPLQGFRHLCLKHANACAGLLPCLLCPRGLKRWLKALASCRAVRCANNSRLLRAALRCDRAAIVRLRLPAKFVLKPLPLIIIIKRTVPGHGFYIKTHTYTTLLPFALKSHLAYRNKFKCSWFGGNRGLLSHTPEPIFVNLVGGGVDSNLTPGHQCYEFVPTGVRSTAFP